jgi:hypothetical protein
MSSPNSPKLEEQPVMVLEIPREIVFPNTTSKYFNQTSAVLKLRQNVRPIRWRYIGKFLIIPTNLEQVRPLAESSSFEQSKPHLICFVVVVSSPFFHRHTSQQDSTSPTTTSPPMSYPNIYPPSLLSSPQMEGKTRCWWSI